MTEQTNGNVNNNNNGTHKYDDRAPIGGERHRNNKNDSSEFHPRKSGKNGRGRGNSGDGETNGERCGGSNEGGTSNRRHRGGGRGRSGRGGSSHSGEKDGNAQNSVRAAGRGAGRTYGRGRGGRSRSRGRGRGRGRNRGQHGCVNSSTSISDGSAQEHDEETENEDPAHKSKSITPPLDEDDTHQTKINLENENRQEVPLLGSCSSPAEKDETRNGTESRVGMDQSMSVTVVDDDGASRLESSRGERNDYSSNQGGKKNGKHLHKGRGGSDIVGYEAGLALQNWNRHGDVEELPSKDDTMELNCTNIQQHRSQDMPIRDRSIEHSISGSDNAFPVLPSGKFKNRNSRNQRRNVDQRERYGGISSRGRGGRVRGRGKGRKDKVQCEESSLKPTGTEETCEGELLNGDAPSSLNGAQICNHGMAEQDMEDKHQSLDKLNTDDESGGMDPTSDMISTIAAKMDRESKNDQGEEDEQPSSTVVAGNILFNKTKSPIRILKKGDVLNTVSKHPQTFFDGDKGLLTRESKDQKQSDRSGKKGARDHRKSENVASRSVSPAASWTPPADLDSYVQNGGDDVTLLIDASSTTEAIAALPAQEVSITASTSIRRSFSSASATPNVSRSSSAVNLPSMAEDVDNAALSSLTLPRSKNSVKGGKSKKAGNGEGKYDKHSSKAAKMFNRAVRACVENSDPDSMRVLLHNPDNKNFALDAIVLETVMKAYVMAAMFEDALYCLRHCALPGTLSCVQSERILQCLPQNLRNSSAFVAADMINALCIGTHFESQNRRTYFLRIVRGIALEFLEEATSARDRICSAPCERLVRSGLCVVDGQLKRGKKPTDLIIIPGNQLGVFFPDNSFMDNRGIQAGDAVSILPYAGPYPMSAESLDRNMIEATVSQASPLMILKLQDKTNVQLYNMLTEPSPGNVYRIDKLANRMGFNRQLAAAVSICDAPTEAESSATRKFQRRPCLDLVKAITAMDENIDRVMRGAVNGQFGWMDGTRSSTAQICGRAVPVLSDSDDGKEDDDSYNHDEMRDAQESIREKTHLLLDRFNALEGMNASQTLAIEGAATNRLTLVQGPPGTGKTAVAIRILKFWADVAFSVEGDGSPILATSDSNIAVDNLVEGCANAGLRVVRLGRPEAIRPELLKFCIDKPVGAGSSTSTSERDGNTYASLGSFKDKMKRLKSAQIICCTCIGSGGDILDNMSFERVLVDEATQATEPAVLVPLTRGCCQLVLVGDHCQLPPTVLSTRAEEEGLGVPLFSRMVACGVPPFMLDTQYRMHPSIAMFPSDLFYGGKLLNGVSPPERRPLAGFPWPREEFPVAFVPVKLGVEMDDGVSKFNEAEAAAACDAVDALLRGGQCTVLDIAVVTPYAAQVRLIRRMLRKLVQRPPFVEVSSVDGFQGREKEAVIFSAVRSNSYGAVGFVSDWRRVNVSFTRARRALIVIGNDQTLRRGDPDTWMPWLSWAEAHGINMDKPGVPRGRYDAEQIRRVRGGTTAAEMLKDVLARQQAQLKMAEQQRKKAEKNAAGHIMASSDDENSDDSEQKTVKLEDDLARMANSDGHWDDSDHEEDHDYKKDIAIKPSPSRASLLSSTDENKANDEEGAAQDAWDL